VIGPTCDGASGMLPIPPDLDEMMFAGFLRASPWKWCLRNQRPGVPANAEIVLEGYVNLNELRTEGPSATTLAFTRWRGSTRFFHWNASRAAKNRST